MLSSVSTIASTREHLLSLCIALVGGPALKEQKTFVDAAVAAGVKRFIPSDFGSDTSDTRAQAIVPFYTIKADIIAYLKSKEDAISWTAVITGAFFDWGLKVGGWGFNAKDKSVTLFDEGEATFSATTLHKIGLSLVKVLKHAEETRNQYVYVSSFNTSQKELLATAKKITGGEWAVTKMKTIDHIAAGREKLAKGDHSGIPMLIQGAIFQASPELGNNVPKGLWNDILGLEPENFEEVVKAGLSGRLVVDA